MTVRLFTYSAPAQRVVFGRGMLSTLPDELRRMGRMRALVLSTKAQEADARRLAEALGPLAAGVFPGAVMHTPVAATDDALAAVSSSQADCVVSLGGGSTTGLGKAIALRTGLDQVAIPTTYAGSEATPILGQTADGTKTTLRDTAVLPEVVIYDVDLTLSLPARTSAASGMNAIAHAVEALYAPDRNPVTSTLALQGLAALSRALPAIAADPAAVDAREDALFGAWTCGTCLGTVAMGLHHKLCHVLGGLHDLPHAELHAVILPYACRYNEQAAPDELAQVAAAMGCGDVPLGLQRLARRLALPASLRELGMPESGLETAAGQAVANAYPNPAPLEFDLILALLRAAWDGNPATLTNGG